MEFTTYINYYIFPFLILSIIFISIYRNPIQTTEIDLFKKVMISELVALVLELVSNLLDGQTGLGYLILLWLVNLLYFIIGPLASYYWLNFTCYICFESTVNELGKLIKSLCILPFHIYSVIIVSSPFTGWIFTMNSNNCYERGCLHIAVYILIYSYMLTSIIIYLSYIVNEALHEKKKQCIYLAFITMIPLICGVVQESFNTLWIAFPMDTLLILLVYINIQNRQITTDTLTGINNRSFFEKYIKNLFSQTSDNSNNWYLFIMDIDSFKSINDTYGHVAGDNALAQTGDILQKAFLGTDSVVARYGGDEFAAIVNDCNDSLADSIINKIEHEASEFNKVGSAYGLSISVGYADRNMSDSIKALISSADKMMYLNKKEKKEQWIS